MTADEIKSALEDESAVLSKAWSSFVALMVDRQLGIIELNTAWAWYSVGWESGVTTVLRALL